MSFGSDFESFVERHGRAIRHPDRQHVFVFADGSQWLEPTDHGLRSQCEEPSPNLVQRLFVQREYHRILSAQLETKFNQAESARNIPVMERTAFELRITKARFKELDSQWRSAAGPGAADEAEQKRIEETDRQAREFRAAQAEKDYMDRQEAEFKRASESLRAKLAQV